MGFGRRAMLYLGLAEDDEYADEDYADEPDRPARDRRAERPERAERVDRARPDPASAPALRKVTDGRGVPPGTVETLPRRPAVVDEEAAYRIVTLQPRNYNEARQIGEAFREGTPVIMNLTEMDDRDAKRLVDFAAGLSFGLRGSIEKVTNKVFLLTPSNVSVSAEDKALIAEGGFFNQS
jgi:cell division inhibitor SepF